jgi:hypothetical protein
MTPWFFRSSGVFLGNEKEKREERKNFHHSPTGPSLWVCATLLERGWHTAIESGFEWPGGHDALTHVTFFNNI